MANNPAPTWSEDIAAALDRPSGPLRVVPVAGGDTCESFVLLSSNHRAFIKTAAVGLSEMFSAEADGLEALGATHSVRVPRVLALGQCEKPALAWLALEVLDLQARNEHVDRLLGRQLADVHSQSQDRFGWPRDNFLGKTRQFNQPHDHWVEFFASQRLAPQIRQLLGSNQDPQLQALLPEVIPLWRTLSAGHTPALSLLHGDLWSGNAAALPDGSPVIFDPAVHVGDRECDLAMAELFGGFRSEFFDAYEAVWPLTSGWRERREIYQLYHLLNHANLFAGGYVSTVKRRIQRLQARC